MKASNKNEMRERRHGRIRKKISGTAERPRMAIYRSNRSMSIQFIDDDAGHTLAAVSSGKAGTGNNLATAAELGKAAAASAGAKGIRHIVVDRGGYQYHGRVKAIVESAIAAGLSTSAKEDK